MSVEGPVFYYIDESGHTGDLSSTRSMEFADQPVFALAAIGVPDPAALAGSLERLRRTHRCARGELKSSMARLPALVSDLVEILDRLGCPLFIEVVDKRFFVTIHIVNHLLCGGLPIDFIPMRHRNAIAEFVSDAPSDQILAGYLALCRGPSIVGVRKLLQELWNWLDGFDGDVAHIARILTLEARDRAALVNDPAQFLPIFDTTGRGRKVWIIPNLQCLTNIYARINLSRPGGLNGTVLIHDDQLQYGSILEDAKLEMERLSAASELPTVPFADYRLKGAARLRFEASSGDPCLQAADLLAGCAMRFARSELAGTQSRPSLRAAVMRIMSLGNPLAGHGINFVFSRATLARMRIPVLPG